MTIQRFIFLNIYMNANKLSLKNACMYSNRSVCKVCIATVPCAKYASIATVLCANYASVATVLCAIYALIATVLCAIYACIATVPCAQYVRIETVPENGNSAAQKMVIFNCKWYIEAFNSEVCQQGFRLETENTNQTCELFECTFITQLRKGHNNYDVMTTTT